MVVQNTSPMSDVSVSSLAAIPPDPVRPPLPVVQADNAASMLQVLPLLVQVQELLPARESFLTLKTKAAAGETSTRWSTVDFSTMPQVKVTDATGRVFVLTNTNEGASN